MSINRIGVFTSGGDAPGMNAAVRAVVRAAKRNKIDVSGIRNGYEGMINGEIDHHIESKVPNILQRGGTILRTARSKEFMTEEGRKSAFEQLQKNGIEALVAIGGNGTYTGALKFGEEFNFPIVGLPGTIDNDIYGTDYTIGFDTAINTAIDAIDKIRDTADSHNRLFFIEVMGRHAGHIALHTGIGSGAYDVFLPETETDIPAFVSELTSNRKKLFNLVIVAEGNTNGTAQEIADMVKESGFERDVRVTVIGHLQRGGSPTCADRVLASRLGYHAVNALIEGKKGVAIGIENNMVSYTPFEEAIFRAKPLNEDMKMVIEALS